MDIQVSSNFERLLFEAHGRNGAAIRRLMDELAGGAFAIAESPLAAIREDFVAGRADEAETAATIRDTWRATGFLPDPHTAVGLAVASRFSDPAVPMVTLATAHPAKFPDAVTAATGHRPELPEEFAGLMNRKESFVTFAKEREPIERFVLDRTRAAEKV
jgi:threonine synthase